MRRCLRYAATPPCRAYTKQQRRSLTTSPMVRWMDTLPGNQGTSTTPSTLQQQQQQQQHHDRPSSTPAMATSGILSQFYRGLATQNIDQLWPLYSTMYQHHLHTRLTRNNYRQLVQVTARSAKTQRNLHRLLAIMEDMQTLSIPLRLSDYNIIMKWVGGATVPERRPRHLTDALAWLSTMEQQTSPVIEPNVVTYNTLIHVASQANDILTAQRLYHAMLAKGIDADAYTYTTLLHSMATMGDVEGVQEMVARLQRKGLDTTLLHSTVTWNMLLDCYYSAESTTISTPTTTESMMDEDEDVMDIGEDKVDDRYQSKADTMFHAMVDALRDDPQQQQQQTVTTAPRADPITFQIHMDHLLRQQQRDDAIRLLLDTMPRHSIQPTITMYNKLFASFLIKEEEEDDHEDIITSTTTSTASSQQQQQQQQQLRQLYTSLLQHPPQQPPTPETLYTLINALLDHHDTTLALEAFVHLCQEKQLAPCQELLDRLSGVIQDVPSSSID
ncbi:hypothetical protein BCR42DRAFT_427185 [Absidia repens]|uniref:Pentacotripeptide-repeat region of PRORP domain-containing protein n=1 Tax=Absidia repens TaxID=90262 RepID=A0A1X2I0F8_9FUNG|nr:hypothetical protein BCR42DRAFT_427185 [Absidia repens]